MELKLTLLMELKDLTTTFNRTFMELKRSATLWCNERSTAFNRTFMELKHGDTKFVFLGSVHF